MQVTEHIHALRIPFSLPDPSGGKIPRFVYVYLIYGEKICLVDSGVACSAPMIFDYLQKTGRSPKDISYLILTHLSRSHRSRSSGAESVRLLPGRACRRDSLDTGRGPAVQGASGPRLPHPGWRIGTGRSCSSGWRRIGFGRRSQPGGHPHSGPLQGLDLSVVPARCCPLLRRCYSRSRRDAHLRRFFCLRRVHRTAGGHGWNQGLAGGLGRTPAG